jgi:cell division protein FtsB
MCLKLISNLPSPVLLVYSARGEAVLQLLLTALLSWFVANTLHGVLGSGQVTSLSPVVCAVRKAIKELQMTQEKD